MKMDELMVLVDEVCNEKGYEDSPAYDLIYSDCVEGRSDEDARELIESMLDEYNGGGKVKKYTYIKQESDAEIYDINGIYIKIVWGYSTGSDMGLHNEFNTDVCVYKWTGEDCTVDELPNVMDSEWEVIDGFDIEVDEDEEIDWEDYARKVDEILAEIDSEKKYAETRIQPHHAGFGMYQVEEYGDAFDKEEILTAIAEQYDEHYILGEDELPEDIEDIRGKIYGEPEIVIATRDKWGVSYLGLDEFE